jgi:D-serine deaminase-like pyridoxal phosphate-dependent protein
MPKTDVLEELKARIAWHRKFEPAPVSILVDAATEIERLRALNADLLAALEALLALWSRPLAADVEIDTALDRARAAVAQAQGGTPY